MSNEGVKELYKLIENVKTANDSSVCILCYKEYEDIFKEYFKGYKILTVDDKFVQDKNNVYIIPYKE